ncbi:uncharacterized protein LY89DRAFT_782563 [Mollisia scopiformis]|uniref:DNA-directed RNA polymerase III subunit Rpc5 n=1 Tax=Mollisia scopiformis TaxID=149040 RepID=A0A194X7Y9_MOLSC|nr:uncharacterized protein LY89DRAFT_782563 [Mollisia scopiformis]KUJ16275.1 hypothetical protein LY89DRAFT_782563 [Mollisia scopiformis]
MADVDMEDPDPIKASYDVFIKPYMSGTQQVYILQFPNRDSRQQYSTQHQSKPLKMRVKPGAGMVELDVPMDTHHNYDKEKGVRWGSAMKKTKANHGLPGGFGIGGSVIAGRRPNNVEAEHKRQQDLIADFDHAVREEHALVKQTLGGQTISSEENTPQYMIGTFEKDQLHLTPVDNIVQMRPQFHHIDAQSEQDRYGRPGQQGRPAEARAVHMMVKSNIDGEEETTDTMAQRITAAQSEQWKSHKFIDEDEEIAWAAYHKSLFVGAEYGVEDRSEVLAQLPKLLSALDDEEYLDFISAPRDAAKLSRSKKITRSKKGKEKETAAGPVESDASSTLSDSSGDEREVVAPA